MAQYQVGTVAVTNGSATVTGVDPDPGSGDVDPPQLWLTEVAPGDLFIVQGTDVWYEIQSVTDDSTLVLTAAYQGVTVTPSGNPQAGANYAIVRDFTSNYALPLLNRGDIETVNVASRALQDIDTAMQALDARIAALEP